MIPLEATIVKSEARFGALQDYVKTMAERQAATHQVEKGIWDQLLVLGHALMIEYFSRVGPGDVGETIRLCDGRDVPRMGLYKRRYVSVFGPVEMERTCYGNGKIEAAPLDALLQLPARDYSYLLQDWSQRFCVEQAYGQTTQTLACLLPLKTTVRTLERINQEAAATVADFQKGRPPCEPETEEALVVAAVDGKGVPLCREDHDKGPHAHRRTKGQKKNKKKMACVGAVYTIAPFVRTAAEVIDELLNHTAQQRRPQPKNKRVQAHLIEGKVGAFTFMNAEIAGRNPAGNKPVLVLADGERAIWKQAASALPGAIEILDLFHVMEKLWLCAHCFHREGAQLATAFVEHRLGMLLEGKVEGVIQGLGQMKTKHRLQGKKAETMDQVIGYFARNKSRMRYDVYLACGYPIGSGVAEGACRHLVKDRLERTGMRWRLTGAQAMLDMRAVYLNGQWEPFWDYHIAQQQTQLYGHIHHPEQRQLANVA